MAPLGRASGHGAFVTALCTAVVLGGGPAQASDPPVVVASIKPVHDLAAGVMAGIARPHLLLPPGTSPHAHSLRPSAARILAKADLILWIGPGLESFLAKPIRTLGRKALSLALVEAEGMALLPSQERGARGIDPHLWLDPRNARQISRLVAATLARLDPGRAGLYHANLATELAVIDRAEAETRMILAPVRHLPYVVFHDAFGYFEKRFGTGAIGAVTLSPERKPGARRVAEIRARINATGTRCVFSEPQFEPALLRTILRGSAARAAVLDPMGGSVRSYGAMLRAIARRIRDCLAP